MDTTQDKQERIVALHLHTQKRQREISKDLGVPQKTVCRIIKLYKETGSTIEEKEFAEERDPMLNFKRGHTNRACKQEKP